MTFSVIKFVNTTIEELISITTDQNQVTAAEEPVKIFLGPISDPQGDGYSTEFDTGGNDFITLDKSNMTL